MEPSWSSASQKVSSFLALGRGTPPCSLVSIASFVPHLLCPAALADRESVSLILECLNTLE